MGTISPPEQDDVSADVLDVLDVVGEEGGSGVTGGGGSLAARPLAEVGEVMLREERR